MDLMDPIVIQAVERVWLSGALWQSHPWESEAHAISDVEKLSNQEQLDLFEKAVAALKLEAANSGDKHISAAIDWEIGEIEKACVFLQDRISGNAAGQLNLFGVE
jgi:hypothetical protein